MSGDNPSPRTRRKSDGAAGENADLRSPAKYAPDSHRMLPSSPDAEQGVLSSFLLSPLAVGGFCAEAGATAKSFHIPAHALIFATLLEMWDAQKPIDAITVTETLRGRNQLDQVGGPAFLTQLNGFLPTAANAEYYLDIVLQKHSLREIIRVCTEFAFRSYEEQENVSGLLDEAETNIFKIAQERFKAKTVGMKDHVMSAISSIQELYERRGSITGLPTGLAELDKMTDGLHAAEMIVIAARPSMGKTA